MKLAARMTLAVKNEIHPAELPVDVFALVLEPCVLVITEAVEDFCCAHDFLHEEHAAP